MPMGTRCRLQGRGTARGGSIAITSCLRISAARLDACIAEVLQRLLHSSAEGTDLLSHPLRIELRQGALTILLSDVDPALLRLEEPL